MPEIIGFHPAAGPTQPPAPKTRLILWEPLFLKSTPAVTVRKSKGSIPWLLRKRICSIRSIRLTQTLSEAKAATPQFSREATTLNIPG